MRSLFLAALLGLGAVSASAMPPPAPPPRLLIQLSVDGLSTVMFDQYRAEWRGGLARVAGGAVFRNGRSGAVPATIADLVEQRDRESLTVAVAGDRLPATRISGKAPDQRWYWQGDRFATDLSGEAPRTVALANSAIRTMIATPQPPLLPPPSCGAPANGTAGRFARPAGDTPAFVNSPAIDGAILALSAALVQELGLGSDARPDVISIDLPATGRTAARFGLPSMETCLQLRSLDRDLGDFFAMLDRNRIDYAVALSGSVHSGSAQSGAAPAIFWRRGIPASDRPDPVSGGDIVATLASMLGLGRLPAANDGSKCLAGIEGIACPPR